ncbi:hypothetical protein D5086_020734 [Populus alba]|uniref:Uncharacterized protein n=1 Tax=Populus alba TaxID=43335 RepID=A0ACC4BKV9_POPAL
MEIHKILSATNKAIACILFLTLAIAFTTSARILDEQPEHGGTFPSGSALQQLMFGTITAIDDEITEGHDLGSGFYRVVFMLIALAFSGFTEQEFPSLSLLSWVALSESMLCFGVLAVVKDNPSVNQHATDGVETLLEFAVYVSY